MTMRELEVITDLSGNKCYVEPVQRGGLSRRVFRYENNLHSAYLEWSYYDDFMNWLEGRSSRARWYGFAGRALPDTFKA